MQLVLSVLLLTICKRVLNGFVEGMSYLALGWCVFNSLAARVQLIKPVLFNTSFFMSQNHAASPCFYS